MSIFNTILEKLGIQKPAAAAPTTAPAASGAKPAMGAPASGAPSFPQGPVGAGPTAMRPASMAMVDVVSKLNNMAGSDSGLDWKVSIVDLLKLLKMDSSLEARKALATELGCPANLMGDSAKMNTWLHQTVLQKISENGGNIPQSLLHS